MNDTLFNRILAHIQHKGIIIEDEKKLETYITKYNYNRVMKPYTKLFTDEEIKQFNFTTNDILNLYELDKKVSMLFLRNILEIEKRLNTAIAYVIIDNFQLFDGCIFKLERKFIMDRIFTNCSSKECDITFDQLISKMTKYAHINPNTSIYENVSKNNLFFKWQNCPIDALCLTWTFTTTALAYLALSNNLKEKVIQTFGVSKGRIAEFNIFIYHILGLRNIITHNNVLISNLQCLSENDLLNSFNSIIGGRKQFLTIYDLAVFLQYFSGSQSLQTELYECITAHISNPQIRKLVITSIGERNDQDAEKK